MSQYMIRIWDKINQSMSLKDIECDAFPEWLSMAQTDKTIAMLPSGKVDLMGHTLYEGDFFIMRDSMGNLNKDNVRFIEYDLDENKFVVQGWSKNSDSLDDYASSNIQYFGNVYENKNDPHIWFWMRWQTDKQIASQKEWADRKSAKILKYLYCLVSKRRLKRKSKSEILKWIRWKMPKKWQSKWLFLEFLLTPGLSSVFGEEYEEIKKYENGYEGDGLEHPRDKIWGDISGG